MENLWLVVMSGWEVVLTSADVTELVPDAGFAYCIAGSPLPCKVNMQWNLDLGNHEIL